MASLLNGIAAGLLLSAAVSPGMGTPGWVPVPATKGLTTFALSDALSRDPTPPTGQPTRI